MTTIVWGYRGPSPSARRLWQRGPNWWQLTLGHDLIGHVAIIRRWDI